MKANWWENFFHGVALDFWRAAISEEQTRTEAGFIQKHLKLSPGAKILDVPCGNGRHSLALAQLGFALTGVDIAAEFITEAKEKSQQAKLKIDWQQREMRDLPWNGEFDGGFCFGNSFGYLNDDENAEFLRAVSQTLKPGARFILEAPAIAECILPNFHPEREFELGGITTTIECRYDHELGRMFNDFTFVRNGIEDKRASTQRTYTYKELIGLLKESGLETVAAYASLDEQPFKLGSQRLFLICVKQGRG